MPDAAAGGHARERLDHLLIGFVLLGRARVFHVQLHRLHVVLQLADLAFVVAQHADEELVAAVAYLVLDAAHHALQPLLGASDGEGVDVAVEYLAFQRMVGCGQGHAGALQLLAVARLEAEEHPQIAGLLAVEVTAHKLVVAVALAFALDKAGTGVSSHDVATTRIAHLAGIADAEIGIEEVVGDFNPKSLSHFHHFKRQYFHNDTVFLSN